MPWDNDHPRKHIEHDAVGVETVFAVSRLCEATVSLVSAYIGISITCTGVRAPGKCVQISPGSARNSGFPVAPGYPSMHNDAGALYNNIHDTENYQVVLA